MPRDKWTSAGGVVLDKLEEPYHVYVVKPSNNYGPWCFPKGRVDPGEDLHSTALREVQEEAGVPAKIIPGANLGTGVGSYSITHYFLMVQDGPLGSHDHETEEVRLATFDEARELFSSDGNSRDVGILGRAISYLDANKSEKKEEVPMSEAPSPKKPMINELHVNLLGKIFFTACAAWLVGKATNIKLRGTQEEIRAVSEAMMSSRRFQEELENPGATMDSVMNKLGLKHASAREFERILNVPWPL